MTRIIIIVLLVFAGIAVSAQQTFTVTTTNFKFTPALIEAKIGDIITFSVGTSHPVLQVDEATYNVNGKTALSGGFAFPSGAGTFTLTAAGNLFYICTNHISSGMKGKIVVSQATGLESPGSLPEFDIYPNPVNDYLLIKSSGSLNPISATVFDIAGKKITQTEFENSDSKRTSVLVYDLRKGMYFISVTYPDKTYTRKFIKL